VNRRRPAMTPNTGLKPTGSKQLPGRERAPGVTVGPFAASPIARGHLLLAGKENATVYSYPGQRHAFSRHNGAHGKMSG
jgi:hypothetical protein